MKYLWLAAFSTLVLFLFSGAALAAGDAAKGKQVYLATCSACHGPDPAKAGVLGPAIKGSSLALVRARVMFGNVNFAKSYPPGYKPKRPTRMMVPMTNLKKNIPDLAAFLK